MPGRTATNASEDSTNRASNPAHTACTAAGSRRTARCCPTRSPPRACARRPRASRLPHICPPLPAQGQAAQPAGFRRERSADLRRRRQPWAPPGQPPQMSPHNGAFKDPTGYHMQQARCCPCLARIALAADFLRAIVPQCLSSAAPLFASDTLLSRSL